MTDLVKRLRDGVPQREKRWSGDTHYDLGGSDLVDAADVTMAKAADHIEALTTERDDADRRAGAAERHLAWANEENSKRSRWLRKAKEERGYGDEVSFDRVWEEACKGADSAKALQAENERLREALECLEKSDDGMTADIARAALQEVK